MLASEETYVSLLSLNGALELVDLCAGDGEVFLGDGCALADGVHQPPRDSAGGFADVRVIGDVEEGCGGSQQERWVWGVHLVLVNRVHMVRMVAVTGLCEWR